MSNLKKSATGFKFVRQFLNTYTGHVQSAENPTELSLNFWECYYSKHLNADVGGEKNNMQGVTLRCLERKD